MTRIGAVLLIAAFGIACEGGPPAASPTASPTQAAAETQAASPAASQAGIMVLGQGCSTSGCPLPPGMYRVGSPDNGIRFNLTRPWVIGGGSGGTWVFNIEPAEFTPAMSVTYMNAREVPGAVLDDDAGVPKVRAAILRLGGFADVVEKQVKLGGRPALQLDVTATAQSAKSDWFFPEGARIRFLIVEAPASANSATGLPALGLLVIETGDVESFQKSLETARDITATWAWEGPSASTPPS
jgi:hypothetical protein